MGIEGGHVVFSIIFSPESKDNFDITFAMTLLCVFFVKHYFSNTPLFDQC